MSSSIRLQKLLSQLNVQKNSSSTSQENSELSRIDHIVYYCKDLESSIVKFSSLFGVSPVISGRHKQWGSWNALFSLNNDTYFELLADDPKSEIEHSGLLKTLANNISSITGEGIITYMIRPPIKYKSKLNKFHKDILNQTNYDMGQIFGGQRETMDKKILKWQLLSHINTSSNNNNNNNNNNKMKNSIQFHRNSQGIIPTIIDWNLESNLQHPSNTSPKGCTLLKLTCFHPKANEYQQFFEAMKMESRWELNYAKNVQFQAKIKAPNGKVFTL